MADESGRPNDRQLSRYLLGLLSREETESLDEASIIDDEVALRLRVVEHDLVDAYVTGTLPPDMLAPFESHYLTTHRRQQYVAFAQRFLPAVERAADAGTEYSAASVRHRSRLSRWRRVAAAALLIVASGGLLFQAVRLHTGLDLAQSARVALDRRARALEQQLLEQRAATAAATQELERVRESVDVPAPQSAEQNPTIALVLQPQTRAIGPVPTLAIRSGGDRVAFALQLESNDVPRYRVVLRDPATDRAVWTSAPIAPTALGEISAVAVVIPSRVLEAQHYSLVLTDGDVGTADAIGSYTFRVVRR